MVTDPLGDMLVQIKNAGLAGKKTVDLPFSKMKEAVGHILVQGGYLGGVESTQETPHRLRLILKYQDKLPVITNLKRVSKPGLRVYVKVREIPIVIGGLGMTIISTPQGVMTGQEAKKRKLGGELLCKIW